MLIPFSRTPPTFRAAKVARLYGESDNTRNQARLYGEGDASF
jgi:hypothetical protein